MKDFASAIKACALIAVVAAAGVGLLYLLQGPTAAVALISSKVRAFLLAPGVWDGVLISVGIMIAVLLLEAIVLGWDRSGLKRIIVQPSRSCRFDWFFALLFVTRTLPFFQVFFTLGISIGITKLTALVLPAGDYRLTIAPEGYINVALAVAGLWLIYTFNDYWWHRLMHAPLFWPLHRMHHTATELSVFSQFRDNPGNAVLTKFSLILPVVFFKISPEVLMIYTLVGAVNGSITHCELPWTFGLLGRWLICSPIVHQIHHSAEEKHYNANFSFCPLWDRLFGTWYAGEERATNFGVADDHYENMPLISSIWADLREFYWNFPQRAGLRRPRSVNPALQ